MLGEGWGGGRSLCSGKSLARGEQIALEEKQVQLKQQKTGRSADKTTLQLIAPDLAAQVVLSEGYSDRNLLFDADWGIDEENRSCAGVSDVAGAVWLRWWRPCKWIGVSREDRGLGC